MPALPGGTANWLPTLGALVNSLVASGPVDASVTVTVADGSSRPASYYADQLSPAGLIARHVDGTIGVSELAARWSALPTNELLLGILHRHVRFVGEALAEFSDGSLTVRELHEIANKKFKLGWKSLDQVRRRTSWLSVLGFIEESFDLTHAITVSGRRVLSMLTLEDPLTLWQTPTDPLASQPIKPAGPAVGQLLENLLSDPGLHDERRRVLGYVPTGSNQSPIDALRRLTTAAIPEIETNEFEQLCSDLFSIKQSSARSALATMRASGLFEPSGRSRFTATEAAREWIESEDDVNLIRILHSNIKFVGEILSHVDEFDRAPDLHRFAAENYGLTAGDNATTTRNVQLLRMVGALRETGFNQYALTERGRTLLAELPLAALVGDAEQAAEPNAQFEAATPELDSELREAAVDSRHPERFEIAVRDAFRRMGFIADKIGGAGNTDVVVEARTGASHVRAIVDAKTAGIGVVSEQAISIQAIQDHRTKHGADFAAIVAPGFMAGRLSDWAEKAQIALISVDQLCWLMKQQIANPLFPEELVLLFDGQTGLVQLEELWATKERRNQLVSLIISCLIRESEEDDPVLGATLDVPAIYRAIRDQVQPRPTLEELQEVLDFLSSPFLGILLHEKNSYSIRETAQISSYRLQALARAVEKAERGSSR
ncbi:restriction endonuclease [Herbiconiux sp. P16]|uniref:restriction endonuclease n=1 Tax=Herbiconiux wuyangfengii TaxID=3342794 RepID=UPI0035B8C21E